MTPSTLEQCARQEAYGQQGLTFVDRFGVYLSRRAILRWLPRRDDLEVLDLGCGYQATLLRALLAHLRSGVGVDVQVAPEAQSLPKLSFIESPLETVLPELAPDRFDVVLLMSVL